MSDRTEPCYSMQCSIPPVSTRGFRHLDSKTACQECKSKRKGSTAILTIARDHATLRDQTLPPSASRNVHKSQLSPGDDGPYAKYGPSPMGRYAQSDLNQWCLSANSSELPSHNASPTQRHAFALVKRMPLGALARRSATNRTARQSCS